MYVPQLQRHQKYDCKIILKAATMLVILSCDKHKWDWTIIAAQIWKAIATSTAFFNLFNYYNDDVAKKGARDLQ